MSDIGKSVRKLKRKHQLCKSELEEREITYFSEDGEKHIEFIIFCPKCGIEVEDQEVDNIRNKRKNKQSKFERQIRRKRSYDEWN